MCEKAQSDAQGPWGCAGVFFLGGGGTDAMCGIEELGQSRGLGLPCVSNNGALEPRAGPTLEERRGWGAARDTFEGGGKGGGGLAGTPPPVLPGSPYGPR